MPTKAEKNFKLSVFIFRRDLRLYDNQGLLNALKGSEKVIPCFFLEEGYLEKSNKKLYRPNALQFLSESLTELNKKLTSFGSKLYIFKGNLFENFSNLISTMEIEAVFVNEDYTPFSRRRDEKLKKICDEKEILFLSYHDMVLFKPGSVRTKSDKPYKVFTPFYKTLLDFNPDKPDYLLKENFYNKNADNSFDIESLFSLIELNDSIAQRGGRKNAVEKLNNIKDYEKYKDERDFPAMDGTTKLSAHIRFGTVSIREVYWKVRSELGLEHTLVSELIWREFYYHLGYDFPHVFSESFLRKYNDLEWENDEDKFNKWCNGKTGFPIVDAGMRQLNKTGWMHNRVRMIVASFLVKDLHIDWKWGEQYFRKNLVDYDPFSNNGGWQWSASTGADAQPYFRIFNPWLQQQRFDPDSEYIKTWVEELREVQTKEINSLYELKVEGYPAPIVDHKEESAKAKDKYKKLG